MATEIIAKPDLKSIGEYLNTPLALPFEWRGRGGVMHKPQEMATSHLFFTLRMIWNHKMPPAARLVPFQLYSFGPTYTDEYFKTAIAHLYTELCNRTDLSQEATAGLKHMHEWLGVHQLEMKE